MAKKTISLVLGSGGARGLFHIGVIRWLLENDYEIKSISGCSMGALVGGIYAMGKLDVFEEWVCHLSKLDTFRLLDVSWGSGGLIQGDKIMHQLADLVGDQTIESLPITYTAVAMDLKNGKEVWMDNGSVLDAIRASISLPLFFKPAVRNGIQLIDGGCLNPVPVSPTLRDNNDITLAINLDGPADRNLHVEESTITETIIDEIEKSVLLKPSKKEEEESSESDLLANEDGGRFSKIPQSLLKYKESFVTQLSKRTEQKTEQKLKPDTRFFEVSNQAFDAMQSIIARHKLAANPPDYEVMIARNTCGTLEFDRAREMIDLGYLKAEEFLSNMPK